MIICPNQTPLLSGSRLTEEKLSTGFQLIQFKEYQVAIAVYHLASAPIDDRIPLPPAVAGQVRKGGMPSLASQTQPTPAWITFSITHGLVTLSRFLCAMSQLPRKQSDWLQLHNSELISMRETAESEERGG